MSQSNISAHDLFDSLNPNARSAPESGIVEVINHGRDKDGLIPLWAGEGDTATPSFIWEAATRSLAAGETFYTWQRGIPDLRQALARYHDRIYGQGHDPERFFVTGSGMQSIRIALDLVASPGDDVVLLTPVWPNFAAAASIGGVRPVEVALDFDTNRWSLDPERLAAAITPKTRAIFVNTPNNPTGWTASADELRAILDLARKHGLWIIADEIYGRFYFRGDRAPSFRDHADPGERVLYVNTFSKNWAMTGWRIGWIEAPAELGQVIENLIQYATSGVAGFMQRAGVAALDQGEDFSRHLIQQARSGRDIVCGRLRKTGRVRFAEPDGAFYLFFALEGEPDTDQLGLTLVDQAGVGMAPGRAFGDAGKGFIRLCFLRSDRVLNQAAERLAVWIEQR
ncbi:MAG: pyridoxal phosphate-dependent aminotransferase [Pseudomonadota bacterium]